MLKVCIPVSKEKIQKQIEALKYILAQDISDKDKQIHSNAIESLEKALQKF